MDGTNALNFAQMQDDVISARFNESQREQVQRWLNHRYAWVWARQMWPWKIESQLVGLGAGSHLIDPSDFFSDDAYERVLQVANYETGDKLTYRTVQEAFTLWDWSTDHPASVPAGEPDEFTYSRGENEDVREADLVFNRAPLEDRQYITTVVLAWRPMQDDSDFARLPFEFHEALCLGAIATGLKRENDPTWRDLEDEFMAWVGVLEGAYLPPDHPENWAYGGDNLGYESW